MKTPKRHYELTTMEHCATERVWDRPQEEVSAQRWKRKNRIAQLKRSLEKYKHGTHLSGSVAAAYRRLQCVVRPGENATLAEWATYLHELRRIQEHITDAISNTAIHLAYDAERKVKGRKEQEND